MSKKLASFLVILFAVAWLSPLYTAKAAVHAPGTNVVSNGTIYMITDDGYRRPYTSAGAYLSYGFNTWASVTPASTEDMLLPEGKFIPPRDGKIVCSDRGGDKGTCYLITNGKRAAFVSADVFTKLGFSFRKTLTGDVSFLEQDGNITTSSEQHRSGVLINKSGTIYLVTNGGLLGVPSMDILRTWGYSLEDVVVANNLDSNLSQTSTITSRSGAKLSPVDNVRTDISEQALVQGYIDTYPSLPTNTISAPEDGASVISLVQKIEAIPGNKIDPVYPYMTSQSIEMLTKAPGIKSYMEAPSVFLPGMNQTNSNIQVFEGGTFALYTKYTSQTGTALPRSNYWVCKKENGVWKWDLIGTWKYQDKINYLVNPGNAYTLGVGNSDIAITDAEYTAPAMVNDTNTLLLVELKNNGQTTIEKFHIVVRLNGVIITDEIDSYEITPGRSAVIAVPLDYYWQVTGTNKSPGQYTTDIVVGFDSNPVDANVSNNEFHLNTNFQANTSVIQ